MDWPASSTSLHHYTAPSRGAWSGTTQSSSAKRQRQSIKSGQASLTHIAEQAYAGLNTRPRRVLSVNERFGDGVVVDVGLLGAATLVVQGKKFGLRDGLASAAKEELKDDQQVHWTFMAEDDDNFRLLPVGPIIPLFPATIKHQPDFYPRPMTITESQPDYPGPSLRTALNQNETFLASHPDLTDDASLLSFLSSEVSDMYNPSTYIPGLKEYKRGAWKRRREPSDGQRTENEEDDVGNTQTTSRVDDTHASDFEPRTSDTTRGRATQTSYMPEELRKERNEIYLGNVNKLVLLRLKKARRNSGSGSTPTSPNIVQSHMFSKVLARKLSGSLRKSKDALDGARDSDESSDAGSIRKGKRKNEGIEGSEEKEVMILAFPMGENGSDLNLSSFTYTRPRRTSASQTPQKCCHRFEPTHVPSWSFTTPILQLSASHASVPDDAIIRDNAIHLAVRTVTNVHIFALSRPRRKISKVAKQEHHNHLQPEHIAMNTAKQQRQKDPTIPADVLEITSVTPERIGGRRIVDVQMHPTEWQCAVMVDDAGGVWRWTTGIRRIKYASREGVDEIVCILPASASQKSDGFFRVAWGLEHDTVLICSAKMIQRIIIQGDGSKPNMTETLLDLSPFTNIILAVDPSTLERGSGLTCVVTDKDILWVDELCNGKVMMRSPHHLGYDRSMKIRVEQAGPVNRAFITSNRISHVIVSTSLADRRMPKILHDPYLLNADGKSSDCIEGLTSVMLEGWTPWYHLVVAFGSQGGLLASFATADCELQRRMPEQEDTDRLLCTAKWHRGVVAMATRSSDKAHAAKGAMDSRHIVLDFRDIRQSLINHKSGRTVDLRNVRRSLNDLAEIDARDFLTTHDLLAISADAPRSNRLPDSTFLQSYDAPRSQRDLTPSVALENFNRSFTRFRDSQTLAQRVDLSATIESVHGIHIPLDAMGSQSNGTREAFLRLSKARHGNSTDIRNAMERQRFALERLQMDLANSASVVTARDLQSTLDVSNGLAAAMDDLAVRGDESGNDAFKVHFSVIQPNLAGEGPRIDSAEKDDNTLHHGGLRALLSEWTAGEDPSLYQWQEPGYITPIIKTTPKPQRVVLPLRGENGTLPYSQPTGRAAIPAGQFSLPNTSVHGDRSVAMAMFPNTQGAAGPFGTRSDVFAKKKVIKKRIVGF